MENIYIELARLEIYQSRTLPRNHAGVLKVKKIQLEITLSMLEAESKSLRDQLRTAEQERDQYKAELISSRNYWSELYSKTNTELESLHAKIKETQEPFATLFDDGEFVIRNQNVPAPYVNGKIDVYIKPVIPD